MTRAPRIALPLLVLAVTLPAAAVQRHDARVEYLPAGTAYIAAHDGTGLASYVMDAPPAFQERHGEGWMQRVHGPNGNYRHLWGPGIEVDPLAQTDDLVALQAADAFWQEHPELLPSGVDLADLEPWSNVVAGDVRYVSHRQTLHGVPILRSSVFVAISAGRIVWIGARCLPAGPMSSSPMLNGESAAKAAIEAVAERGFAGEAGATELVAFPRVLTDRIDLELVYSVDVDARPHGHWTAYIDAIEGNLVALRDERLFLDATVELEHHERNPATPMVQSGAPYLRVGTDGGNVFADVDGVFTADGASTSAELAVRGSYSRVDNQAGDNLTASFGGVTDGDVLTWDTGGEYSQAQLDAYLFHSQVRAYADHLVDDVDWVHESVAIHVNYDENCNAWFDGDMTFLRAGQGCNNTAMLADVVYHEYGHGFHMSSIIWGVGDWYGDVGEAYADVLAFLQTGESEIAPYFYEDGSGIRDVGPNRVYPDDIIGEVHYDGLIVGGAVWDLRTLLIDDLGESAGQAAVEQIFAGMAKTTSDIPSSYEAALVADDDNGDLADGTPHMCAIDAAFGPHGLVNGSVGALVITHDALDNLAEASDPIPVLATVAAAHPECTESMVGDVRLVWSTDGGASWDEVGMDALGEGDYVAEIPAVAEGTQVRYRIEADDLETGGTITRPSNPADPAYYSYVGPLDEIFCDDFEAENEGWSHELVSGEWAEGADDWMRGIPVGRGGDPDTAASGSYVWGNDLALEDNWDGKYQNSKVNALTSPTHDLSDYDAVRLQFRRWLGVEDGVYDHGRVYVNDEVVWDNTVGDGDTHHQDAEWILFDLDITEQVAGKADVQIRWEIESDQGLQFGGWTLDDVCLYAAQPPAGDDDDDDDDDVSMDDDDGSISLVDNGCECRSGGTTAPGASGLALLLAGVALWIRRRS